MKRFKIGYTQGAYDLFHIGHLNLINHAKEQCDYLIVGVNSDELVDTYKHKQTIVHENERAEIVRNIKAVDECIIVDTLDKQYSYQLYHYDVIFIGDDWKGNERWRETEVLFKSMGVEVVYLPHTDGVSSSLLRKEIENEQNKSVE